MLEVDAVTKVYPPPPVWLRPAIRAASRVPVPALHSIDLTVAAGEVVGLVGPNGAGKTTLMRLIASLLEPTSGHIRIAGHDVQRARSLACQHLGLVLEGDRGLFGRLNGRENLEFFGAMAGMSRADARRRAGELLDLFELGDRDKLVFGYSAGMRTRLSIARALIADPPLIVLDEPTRSLDPVASRATVRMLRELADEGRAILLSDHRLDEVVAVCDRLAVLIQGEIRYQGSPAQLDISRTGAVTALTDLLEREAGTPVGAGS